MDSLQKTHLWKAWLRKYWTKRTLNVPKELNDKEMTYMLQWLFRLEDDFENAVEIVIKGPATKVDGYFWHSIRKNDIIKKFPKAATKLVVFLLESCDEVGFYEREVKELYHELVVLNPEDRESFRNALLKKQIEVD